MDKIKILAVDDEYTPLALIHSTFPEYDITIETSVRKAEEKIKTESYDLFIIDYMMPTLNGIELLEVIEEEYTGKPYTAMLATASGTTHIFRQEKEAGLFHFFLEKPIELPALRRSIAQAIKRVEETKKE